MKTTARHALDVPQQHQLKIARATLKMSELGARIMGDMTHDQARKIILELTGRPAKEDER